LIAGHLDYPPLDIYADPSKKPRIKGAISDRMSRFFNSSYCSAEEAKTPLVSPIFATTDQIEIFPLL
jgi:hypothetical protein